MDIKKHSLRLKKRRLEKKIKKIIFFYIFPSLFLFSLFILLFNSNYLSIKTINVEIKNNDSVDKNKIRKIINNILDEKYYNLFSKRNYLFYPSQEIKDEIKKDFLEIKNVEITNLVLFKSIEIDLVLEDKKYVFCKTLEKKKCFYISSEGKIFKRYKIKNNIKKIIFISNNKDYGGYIFDNEEEKTDIINLINLLDIKFRLKIKYFVKKNKYFYILILENNTKILLNSDFVLDNFSNTFSKITKTGDLKLVDSFFIKDISYINLSLKNRILYCLKGAECEDNF